MDIQKPVVECKVPTFVHHVLKNEFEDDNDGAAVPVTIHALNSDNPVSEEEKEKRKRKRLPRKIEKGETTENYGTAPPVDNKPYKCDMCHWQFKQRYRFKRHMRTHTGERPYQCPQCEKQFSRSHILKVHMMIHTGEKPFQCAECGWSFMKKYHLQRHMRTHTGEMPFVCEECGVHFSRQYYLKKHLVSAHGAAIVIKPAKPKKKSAASASDDAAKIANDVSNEVIVENKDTIQVVFSFEEDELMNAGNGDDARQSAEEEEEEEDEGEEDGADDNLPRIVTVESHVDNTQIKSTPPTNTKVQSHTIIYSSNHNGTTIMHGDGTPIHQSNGHNIVNQNDNENGLPSEENETLNSTNPPNATNSTKSEASLKECIEMVNQLVDRRSMETMTLKRDLVNNEAELDFNTIPVK